MNDLHARIALALGWTLRDVRSLSLASLRDLARGADRGKDVDLMSDIDSAIRRGTHLYGDPL